jgi:tripartite motif-containing protein 71
LSGIVEGSLHWNTTAILAAGNLNGTAGSSASELNTPRGIFVDQNDFLYIADNFNHRIQKWGINSTSGTTVAGSAVGTLGWTSSLLDYPTYIYVDTSLNMYILDMWNLRVLQWLYGASGGTTIAGTGNQGNTSNSFNQAFTMGVDMSNSRIYLADLINNRIMLWPFFANSSSLIIPLTGLAGVTTDTAGNVYATSNSVNTVTRFPRGSISGTVMVSSGLSYPWGLRFDTYGNLYVADSGTGTIQMYCAGFTAGTVGTIVASGLNQPLDVAFDSNMNLYVCEYGNNRIVKFMKLP